MKNITVITKLKLKPNSLESFNAFFEKWQKFLGKVSQCQSIELVVHTPDTVLWLEGWNSDQQLNKFISEHLIYASYTSEAVSLSYEFDRSVYKKIS